MAKELATQLIEQLQAAGVQRIYGIVGDSLNPIVDAVRKTGGSRRAGSTGSTSGMRRPPPSPPRRKPS